MLERIVRHTSHIRASEEAFSFYKLASHRTYYTSFALPAINPRFPREMASLNGLLLRALVENDLPAAAWLECENPTASVQPSHHTTPPANEGKTSPRLGHH